MMVKQIELGDITIDVEQKDIKNIHLSVHPPTGRVRISAPTRLDLDTIRVYAISKLDWIKQQQKKFLAQSRETPREYLERESHYLWGSRYLLSIVETDSPPSVEVQHSQIVLRVRPGADERKKQAVMEEWYRQQLKLAVPPLIEKWEKLMEVKVNRIFVQRMKTRWGSCNHPVGNIRLNSELAKKPRPCLEYVIVHEMAHLLEPSHNARFVALMDRFLPHWQQLRDELNQAPLGHVEWEY
jgi:predicted metal-dependent hydrolase